jgi:hypothetical protein
MSEYIIEFPNNAKLEKIIPKKKFYEQLTSNKQKVKNLFQMELEKIIWAYKLSADTIKVSPNTWFSEIQIFTLILKTNELSKDILKIIDKLIPHPIFFQIKYGNKIKYAACYKKFVNDKIILSDYFITDWFDNIEKKHLPIVLYLGDLYNYLIKTVLPVKLKKNETLEEAVERYEKLNIKIQKLNKLKTKLQKEKQFNRKIDLNKQIKILNKEIDKLKN